MESSASQMDTDNTQAQEREKLILTEDNTVDKILRNNYYFNCLSEKFIYEDSEARSQVKCYNMPTTEQIIQEINRNWNKMKESEKRIDLMKWKRRYNEFNPPRKQPLRTCTKVRPDYVLIKIGGGKNKDISEDKDHIPKEECKEEAINTSDNKDHDDMTEEFNENGKRSKKVETSNELIDINDVSVDVSIPTPMKISNVDENSSTFSFVRFDDNVTEQEKSLKYNESDPKSRLNELLNEQKPALEQIGSNEEMKSPDFPNNRLNQALKVSAENLVENKKSSVKQFAYYQNATDSELRKATVAEISNSFERMNVDIPNDPQNPDEYDHQQEMQCMDNPSDPTEKSAMNFTDKSNLDYEEEKIDTSHGQTVSLIVKPPKPKERKPRKSKKIKDWFIHDFGIKLWSRYPHNDGVKTKMVKFMEIVPKSYSERLAIFFYELLHCCLMNRKKFNESDKLLDELPMHSNTIEQMRSSLVTFQHYLPKEDIDKFVVKRWSITPLVVAQRAAFDNPIECMGDKEFKEVFFRAKIAEQEFTTILMCYTDIDLLSLPSIKFENCLINTQGKLIINYINYSTGKLCASTLHNKEIAKYWVKRRAQVKWKYIVSNAKRKAIDKIENANEYKNALNKHVQLCERLLYQRCREKLKVFFKKSEVQFCRITEDSQEDDMDSLKRANKDKFTVGCKDLRAIEEANRNASTYKARECKTRFIPFNTLCEYLGIRKVAEVPAPKNEVKAEI